MASNAQILDAAQIIRDVQETGEETYATGYVRFDGKTYEIFDNGEIVKTDSIEEACRILAENLA